MTELERKLSSLKCKSLISIFTSLSTMKFDCNPKYTIPYVKVCDNVYLTERAIALQRTLLPSQFHAFIRW